MKKELAIILILLSLLSLTDRVTGQDTLIVNAELVHQREADSLRAYNYFEKAQRFNLISQSDSIFQNLLKSPWKKVWLILRHLITNCLLQYTKTRETGKKLFAIISEHMNHTGKLAIRRMKPGY
jgi:hypothetical protein